jgi:hypothetical protein
MMHTKETVRKTQGRPPCAAGKNLVDEASARSAVTEHTTDTMTS